MEGRLRGRFHAFIRALQRYHHRSDALRSGDAAVFPFPGAALGSRTIGVSTGPDSVWALDGKCGSALGPLSVARQSECIKPATRSGALFREGGSGTACFV